jgi:RNA polymerase sigma-70 factor (ECF subfamily)
MVGRRGLAVTDEPADEDLVRAFQAGDESAFSRLVERHRRAVYAAARSVLRRHDAADEAAQDAFVKAWQGLKSFKGESSVRTWLYRIGVNAALDHRAREATQDRAKDETRRLGVSGPRAVAAPRALDELIETEQVQRVREAVARLPERQRLTLTMRVQGGLKFSEIADALGSPIGTVKANFHHAVHNLRRLVAPESAQEDASALAAGDAP